MDPLSVTITLVTFASFLKDVVELGLTIKKSIDKVGVNQKRLHNIVSEVVRGLKTLERYYQEHKYILNCSTELGTTLAGLHAELLLVRDRCQQIIPAQRGSRFELVKANVKAWTRRDDIEADIARLKEHIHGCYLQFTAFATARIEHNLLVHRMEDQARLSRLEGLVTRLLVDAHADHSPRSQAFGSTTTVFLDHNNIEYQFLRLQIKRIVQISANLAVSGLVRKMSANLPSEPLMTFTVIPPVDDAAVQLREVLVVALKMLCFVQDNPAGVYIQDWAEQMASLAGSLHDLRMLESATLGVLAVDLYRTLTENNPQAFMQYLGLALYNSSIYHSVAGNMKESLVAIQDSVMMCRLLHDTNPHKAYQLSLARNLRELSRTLSDVDQALASAMESLSICRALASTNMADDSMPHVNEKLDIAPLMKQHGGCSEFIWPSSSNPLIHSYETALSLCRLSHCLANIESSDEAYAAQKESLDILLSLSTKCPGTFHADLADAQLGMYHCLLHQEIDQLLVFPGGVDK